MHSHKPIIPLLHFLNRMTILPLRFHTLVIFQWLRRIRDMEHQTRIDKVRWIVCLGSNDRDFRNRLVS
jgi:hypothetical protein